MFQAIIAKNGQQLEKLGRLFYHSNKPASLLCLDHIFSTPFELYGSSIQEKANYLDMFFAYAKLLHDVAFIQDPCGKRLVQKLFSVQSLREDTFALPCGTFLYSAVAEQRVLYFGGKGQRTVSNADLTRAFRSSLSERMRRRVMEENEVFRDAEFLSPCFNFLTGSCHRRDCSRAHVAGATVTAWYNTRVRMHLQQILIFQTLHCIDIGDNRWYQQRYVLN